MQQLWRSNAFSAQCRSCDSHPSSQYHWRYRWRWYSSYHPVPYMARIVETSGGGKYQSVAFILFGNTSANFDASRNQSHHMSKPRDSHQLGNQTQKRVSKTVCMGSSYTPRCGISSVMDFWRHRISTGQTPKIGIRPEISPTHAHVAILSVCSRRLAAKYREFV